MSPRPPTPRRPKPPRIRPALISVPPLWNDTPMPPKPWRPDTPAVASATGGTIATGDRAVVGQAAARDVDTDAAGAADSAGPPGAADR